MGPNHDFSRVNIIILLLSARVTYTVHVRTVSVYSDLNYEFTERNTIGYFNDNIDVPIIIWVGAHELIEQHEAV